MFFEVCHHSKKSKARRGTIKTSHGIIQTPAFVPVATKGTLKSLTPLLIKQTKTQLAFVNTYHLVSHPGPEIIAEAGGIHTFAKLPVPLMSDSGGFQVFSLGQSKRRAVLRGGEEEAQLVSIKEDGVTFRSVYDGKTYEFTPEKSIEYQMMIGADVIMAFDECTTYPATYEYSRQAMNRTHKWLERCIDFKRLTLNVKHKQFLYGIIQGGTFEDLRVESARFVTQQHVDGIAIGGVSVGETKEEMRNQVRWVAPYLPQDKPVHLLGVGHLDDIVDLVSSGIDTFDCVEPSRVARMGSVYQMSHSPLNFINSFFTEIDINKALYKKDLTPLDIHCDCYVCKNFSKSYVHHLFKQRELLGYTLATYHNIYVMNKLMEAIRKSIEADVL